MLLGSVFDNYRSKFDQLLIRGGKYVEYIRPVPYQDIPKCYQKMDISIMLYKNTENNREIYPIKLFESMAAGVPVIASNVGGTKNIIMNNQCGIIIDDPSQSMVTRALKRLIDDGMARAEYGRNGRKAFENKYNWGSEENKLINAYEGMIQAKA
jgi:glycosyltransferase involved in cell wall biosynthesis